MEIVCILDLSDTKFYSSGLGFFLRFLDKILGDYTLKILTDSEEFISKSRHMDVDRFHYLVFTDSQMTEDLARQIGITEIYPAKRGDFYALYTSVFWKIYHTGLQNGRIGILYGETR